MKWMKWCLVLALGMGMGLAATGCGSDDDDGLEGTWTAQAFNGEPLNPGDSFTLVINGNGTFTATAIIGGRLTEDTGTWTADDNFLTTVSGGETELILYVLVDDTLTLGPPGEVFVMRR